MRLLRHQVHLCRRRENDPVVQGELDVQVEPQNADLLRAYGAELDIISKPDPETGEYLQARIDRVEYLLRSHENSFWPNQYTNTSNPVAHHQTMREIERALDGEIDYLFCSVSTCGTIRGCAEYARSNNMKVKIIAVDAIGSVIYGGQRAVRLIPGHGAAIKPYLFQPDLADQCVHVSDLECVIGCRRLVRHESILAGGSSGGDAAAAPQPGGAAPRPAGGGHDRSEGATRENAPHATQSMRNLIITQSDPMEWG